MLRHNTFHTVLATVLIVIEVTDRHHMGLLEVLIGIFGRRARSVFEVDVGSQGDNERNLDLEDGLAACSRSPI